MARFDDATVFTNTVHFSSSVRFAGGMALPDNVVGNAQVLDLTDIAATKLQHRNHINYAQVGGADVVDATVIVHLVRATGVVRSIRVRPGTVPTGGDKTVSVDVQKAGNGSNSWTSLLSSPISFSSSDTDHTLKAGTLIGSPVVAANDAIRIVVDAAGSTGTQGQGLVVDIAIDESGI